MDFTSWLWYVDTIVCMVVEYTNSNREIWDWELTSLSRTWCVHGFNPYQTRLCPYRRSAVKKCSIGLDFAYAHNHYQRHNIWLPPSVWAHLQLLDSGSHTALENKAVMLTKALCFDKRSMLTGLSVSGTIWCVTALSTIWCTPISNKMVWGLSYYR